MTVYRCFRNQREYEGIMTHSKTTSSSIKANLTDFRIDKKRKGELFLALGAFLFIILLSWIELKFFGVNSYLFLGIFNLNLILLLVILFLVIRNGVKLFLERRRNVRGSRLRSRLVLAFITLSLTPTVLIFFVAIKSIQTSVDYWFRSQVDNSMEQALEVGKTFYSLTKKRLQNRGDFLLENIRKERFLWGAEGMDHYLVQKSKEYNLSLIGVLSPKLKEQNWHASSKWEKNWPKIKDSFDWKSLKEKPKFLSQLFDGEDKDLVVGVLPVDKAKTGFLVLGETIGPDISSKMDKIVQGVREYKQLKILKQPLKMAFYLILGVMTLLIIFGSMWFGFRLAKEISAPVQALSIGTQRIAHGDLGVRLDDRSADELGLLVHSFNIMAEDLEESQKQLKQAYEDLSKQNQELEARRQYMEVVLNNITAGVISLNKDNKISTVNLAAEKILNIEAKDLLARHPEDLLPAEYMAMLHEALNLLKNVSNTQWQRQLEVRVRDESRKLLLNAVALQDSYRGFIGMVMVFEDITELDKMQRMAAWREVARRIAHEIKNPLTPIKLSAQRLERRFGGNVQDETFTECTGLIVRQVEHLQQMVKEFSSFAKLPEINPAYNDLPSLLEEVVTLFRNSYSHIDWEMNIDEQLPQFRFDRAAIKRVLINLLTNASEALKSESEPNVQIAACYDAGDGLVKIEIRDNGIGLKDEDQVRLFEPYFSSKKGNTGLGLTIVKSIVNDHRGYVRIKANSPKGSIFMVQLPV